MIVKNRKNASPFTMDSKMLAFVILSALFLWTLFLVAFFYPQPSNVSFQEIRRDLVGSAKAIALVPVNWSRANFTDQGIPKIHVDVNFLKRAKALEEGILKQGPDDSVQATLSHGNNLVKVTLKLGGDKADIRKQDEKWSFRIRLKDDDHIFGMKRFTLRSPETKKFVKSVLFYEALRREGLMVPRCFLVEVSFNGKEIGLMTIEEDLSKELLDSQGRKESVILKFNKPKSLNPDAISIFNNFRVAKITALQPNRVALSENLSSDLLVARGLLRAFANGLLPASQVFDPVFMGRFIAVADIWGDLDQLQWHHIRFYLNPITALLEPIGHDANIVLGDADVSILEDESIISAILQRDPKIRAVYQKTVSKLFREMDEGVTKKWSQPLADKQLRILHKDYPYLKGIQFDLIANRAKAVMTRTQAPLKKQQGPINRYPEILQAFSMDIEGKSFLDLVNPLNIAVDVQDIKCVAPADGKTVKLTIRPPIDYPIYLDPTPRGGFPKVHKISYKKKKSANDCQLFVAAKTTEDDSIRWIKAVPYSPVLNKNPIPKLKLSETLVRHPFLRFNANTNTLQVDPGVWDVDQWLVIPEGIELKISQGTTLRFGRSFGLIARGPVTMKGTESDPIILTGQNDTGKKNRWQGVVVLKPDSPSNWSYVIVRNTTGIDLNGWTLTGGVNFYEADLKMKNVTLTGNRSEDALNVVRSSLDLDTVTIRDTVANALDADFSRGYIRGGLYENIGRTKGAGDGINTRGSEIAIHGTVFKDISDKALSAGEKSIMTVTDVSMEQVKTGAVSKNGSSLTLTNTKIHQANYVGLMAYSKKTKYGPGTIVASNLETSSVPTMAIAQIGNLITIDGVKVDETDLELNLPSKTGRK